jgi:hypothetical protein
MRQQTVPNYPAAYTQPASTTERSTATMRNDNSATGEFKINLPPDVVAEMRRGNSGNARSSMHVDFQPGLFGRLIGLFTGRRR